MKTNIITAIVLNDLKNAFRSKYAIGSVFGISGMIIVLLAIVLNPILYDNEVDASSLSPFFSLVNLDPSWLILPVAQRIWLITVLGGGYFIFLTAGISTVIFAADSIAGEKDRQTIDSLLTSPITDKELYTGKLFAALIPGFLSTLLSTLVYSIIMGAYSLSYVGFIAFPNLTFILSFFLIVPHYLLLTTNIMIWISARSATTRDAMQFGNPVISLILVGFNTVIFVLILISIAVLAIAFILLTLVNLVLIKVGLSFMKREKWVEKQ